MLNFKFFSGKQKSSYDQNAALYQCDDGEEHEINNKVYSLMDKKINGLHGAIEVSKENTFIRSKNITVKGVLDEKKNLEKNFWKYGVKVSEKVGVSLIDSKLSSVLVGVVSKDVSIAISGGEIDASKVGAFAEGERRSIVYLTNTQVNLGRVGVKAGEKGYLILEGVSISGNGNLDKERQGLGIGYQSDHAAFHIYGDGYVQFVKGSVDVTDAHGLLLQGNKSFQANIEDSNITVRGNVFYGMCFTGEAASDEQLEKRALRTDLKKTRFVVPNGIAVYSSKSGKSSVFLQDTKLLGDLLLKADSGSFIKLDANASALVGQTEIDKSSKVDFILKNNSQWVLLRLRHKNYKILIIRGVSFISSINLSDSSITFEKPKSSTSYAYQTLYIGKG